MLSRSQLMRIIRSKVYVRSEEVIKNNERVIAVGISDQSIAEAADAILAALKTEGTPGVRVYSMDELETKQT